MTRQKRRAAAWLLCALAAAAGYIPWTRASSPDGEARVTFSLSGREAAQEKTFLPRILIPGGQAVGVALTTDGVLVVDGGAKGKNPLRTGDVIISVQGTPVSSAKALSSAIAGSNSDSVTLGVVRGEKEISVSAATPPDEKDGKRRLGVWVRDSTAGVGTLSFIDPATNAYGALGHAIVDADTGSLLSVEDGAIMNARVVGVTKGEVGRAGELRGSFLRENEQIGSIAVNTACGVYGEMKLLPQTLLYPQGLPTAAFDEIREGKAKIISTVDAEGPKEYEIEIVRCYAQTNAGQKDMLIRVTDEALLQKTGGIVQGMSGSPIIQDGKLVGAVTHVLVNDPTRGYGIFIENMLEAAK